MRLGAAVLLLSSLSPAAFAQRSLGYWYVAPGGVTSSGNTRGTVHLGGGGEVAIGKGFSAGIEGGAVGLISDYTRSVQGVGSVNGYFHFRPSRRVRFDPFVTGGYSLFFRHGTTNLGNFGGGMNYWVWEHVAVRLEFRDHILAGPPAVHFWGMRMGLSFNALSP